MNSVFLKFFMFWFLIICVFLVFLFWFFFWGTKKPATQIKWGIVFSQKHSEKLGLDWRENYLALLDDLKIKNLRLIAYWDLIEKKEKEYDFQDLDWQMEEAQKRDVNVLLVVGRKTPRWPECHLPHWAKDLPDAEKQKRILEFIEKVVLRYRHFSNLQYWQVENEPFFEFGDCPLFDENFLRKEVALVKSLDSQRKVLISESGEFSFWLKAARIGDLIGITMYRKVWFHNLGRYVSYPFSSAFYSRKATLIKKLFGKKVIVVELQAEPWGPLLLYDLPLNEQGKTMNLEKLKAVIDFAKKTGFDEFYFWGGEWWYWLKVKENQPQIWNFVKNLIINS